MFGVVSNFYFKLEIKVLFISKVKFKWEIDFLSKTPAKSEVTYELLPKENKTPIDITSSMLRRRKCNIYEWNKTKI